MERVDFRSDTVTQPTDEMRAVMAAAKVGDDVYGEDPTVNELEAAAAQLVGMGAGLFVASGTMGNLVSILAHAGRGSEAIVGRDSHTFLHEAGGMAVLGGVMPRPLETDHLGRMALEEIKAAIQPDDPHYPRSRLILLENSYGAKNGAPIPADYFAGVRQIADRHGLAVHMDGARFFNALVALNEPPTAFAQHIDSLSFCLSKGLGAPVGSMVCGSAPFIAEARRMRKLVGGGMRQAGILAAAGLYALRQNIERLADDHRRAKRLAEGLAAIPGIVVDPAAIQTNIVFFQLEPDVPLTSDDVTGRMREQANIWLGGDGERGFRAVTHYWIDDEAVEQFLDTLGTIMLNP